MVDKSSQNKKPKKKSKLFTTMVVLACLMFATGLGLILYPFITSIPAYFQKGDQISQWESERQSYKTAQTSPTISGSESTISTNTNPNQEATTEDMGTSMSQTTLQASTEQSGDNGEAQDASENSGKEEETSVLTAEDMFPLKLTIPKIEVEWITNEGADVPTLKKGPGHIPETPLPGEEGRCTISGHRTTYGAPFNRIDELAEGDLIYLEILNNLKFTYKVTGVEIVAPTYVEILNGTNKKELLLTTCFPEYSARERMVVIAELINIYAFDFNLN
jgi:sortase A